MYLDLQPLRGERGGMCPSLPGFARFVSIFPQLSENEMESCRKYEAYFGWIPKQGPITRHFLSSEQTCCVTERGGSWPGFMNESSCFPLTPCPSQCPLPAWQRCSRWHCGYLSKQEHRRGWSRWQSSSTQTRSRSVFLHPTPIGLARFAPVPVVSEDWSKSGNLLMAWVLGKRDWDSETRLEDLKNKNASVG